MNKRAWIAAACVLVVTGCAPHGLMKMAPRADTPTVFVKADRFIVVDQEPLVFDPREKDVWIEWTIDDAASSRRWTFPHQNSPSPGIVVIDAAGEIINCNQRAAGRKFACFNKHTKPGKYKYIIHVTDGAVTLKLDPTIAND